MPSIRRTRLYCAACLVALAACGLPTPRPAGVPRSSSALALSPDGARLAAVNPDSGTVTLVDVPTLSVISEIGMAGNNPVTAAFSGDGSLVVVANRAAGTISFVNARPPTALGEITVGEQPYGVVADAARAYVSLFGAGQVAEIDLRSRTVLRRVEVEPFPAGLALSGDGTTLYVTHMYSGRVSVIDLKKFSVHATLDAPAESNLSQSILLSADGARAYLPVTYSHPTVAPEVYNTAVTPAVNMLPLTPAGLPATLDLAALDQPVNLPFAAALSPDGGTLYVANAGTDDVTVIDLATGRAAAHLSVGRNPRGLALSRDGRQLFVNNTLAGTLSVFATDSLVRLQTLPVTTIPLTPQVLTGQRLFNSARGLMAKDGWLSCATCHLDGGMDGRTWLGFPDGPRNTPALFGAAQTLPLHWSGDLDELQDVEFTVQKIQGGAGLLMGRAHDSLGAPNAGQSPDLDALAAYLSTLGFASPKPGAPSAEPAEAVQHGAYAFRRWGCAGCHPPPLYTDLKQHLTGIGDSGLEHNQHGRGLRMDTPSLLGAGATAPYFHDGSAATLRATFFSSGFHSMGFAMGVEEAQDLEAFLNSLSGAP
jgi:YVTN family beta-propeller protein